ncbi:MAG: tRNA pseudouridine(55) synthase TruB [Anaerolineae bacterium]
MKAAAEPVLRSPCRLCGIDAPQDGDLAEGGILVLDKPSGPTSHDMVDRVRHASGLRRVGHAGTLDPLATGVLVILYGRGTRVSPYLAASDKTYRARVRLGIGTDTDDADGRVVAERPVPDLKPEAIETALGRFRGTISQVPPVYSAIQRGGVRDYERARRGQAVHPSARPVTVHRLELLDWAQPDLVLEVACSAGTYVRALARDLGEALECGGHVASLRRLASGRFRVEDTRTWEEMKSALQSHRWADIAHPLDEAFLHLKPLVLDDRSARRLAQGQGVDAKPNASGDVRVYNGNGRFLALAMFDAHSGMWRPTKVFGPG